MNLYKSFSLYTVASFIERGLAFFLLPIFTFYLTTKDFGILSLVTSIFSFSLPLVTLGIQGAISVAYFNGDKRNYPSYFTSSIVTPFIITIFLTLVILIFKTPIENYLEIPILWVLTIPIFCFLSFFNSLLLIDYQIKNEPTKYITYSLSNSCLNILISLLLVILFKLGYQGRLTGQYFSIIIFSIVGFYILYKKRELLVKKINWVNVKDSLSYGLPLVPHILGAMVINMSDRMFIDYFCGKEELGIYNIGYVIGSAISILCAAFANAIIPFSYELFAIGTFEAKAKVVKVYWLFVLVMIVAGLSVWGLTPLIFKYFIDAKFLGGIKYVPWIVLGYFFQGMYLLFANIIFYLKKTKILFYLSFVNIIINFSLNYFLIPVLGPMGAAYATCVSFFLFFIMIAFSCNRIYPLPWMSILIKTNK
ncbi:oligosaccharide flippase family protein [Flavobacterium sp. MC2016-06]|jgi:O-antigen/teichoic acid export membrane protein|uniref:oligosaccharide flippase family protein n=1 Tax=Flavobacterium sp. MC2016-06 TaxID=2676308 RepID=UPI0012BA8882|nr:oligosaccharide flippase family protein [Flavobacterium sp. MC2016-06]MBU3858638.1 oligosaccharide flippase family protein [Flavobacterium sp. MC2016-06]